MGLDGYRQHNINGFYFSDSQREKLEQIIDQGDKGNSNGKICDSKKEQSLFAAFFDSDKDGRYTPKEMTRGKEVLNLFNLSKYAEKDRKIPSHLPISVKKAVDSMPTQDFEDFKNYKDENGENYEFLLTECFSDIVPNQKDNIAPGTNKTFDELYKGLLHTRPGEKSIAIFGQTTSLKTGPALVNHEMGHFLSLIKNGIGQDPKLKEAYSKDYKQIPEEVKNNKDVDGIGHFINPNDPEEAIAESLGIINTKREDVSPDKQKRDKLFKKYLPNTFKYMKNWRANNESLQM